MLGRARKSALSPHQALALGLLQGPAELLPISSSGHTELIPWLAGWPYAELDGELRKSFEVVLHAGSGVALAIHMRRELLADATGLDRRRAAVIVLSLAPSALTGYALRSTIGRRLGGPRSIAAGLAAGAAAMAVADGRVDEARRREDARACDGLALGLAQASALIPGVSRNGAALSVARARGFARGAAHELSWHAGLPVIFGASALEGARLRRRASSHEERVALALGGGAAFLSTLASAAVVRRCRLATRSLLPYSLYRCLLAAVVISRVRRAHNRGG